MQALARIIIRDDAAHAMTCGIAARAAGFAACELVIARVAPLPAFPDIPPASVLSRPEPAPRGEADIVSLTRATLEWAEQCGIRNLALPAGLAAGLAARELPGSYETAFQAVFRLLELLKDDAAARGVRVALVVPHARFLLSPLECADLIDAVNSPYVGLGVVASAADQVGRAADWMRIAGGRLFWVDAGGAEDVEGLKCTLQSIGYDGLLILPCPGEYERVDADMSADSSSYNHDR